MFDFVKEENPDSSGKDRQFLVSAFLVATILHTSRQHSRNDGLRFIILVKEPFLPCHVQCGKLQGHGRCFSRCHLLNGLWIEKRSSVDDAQPSPQTHQDWLVDREEVVERPSMMLRPLPLACRLWIEKRSSIDDAQSLPQTQQDWLVDREEVIDGLKHDTKATNNATAVTTTCGSSCKLPVPIPFPAGQVCEGWLDLGDREEVARQVWIMQPPFTTASQASPSRTLTLKVLERLTSTTVQGQRRGWWESWQAAGPCGWRRGCWWPWARAHCALLLGRLPRKSKQKKRGRKPAYLSSTFRVVLGWLQHNKPTAIYKDDWSNGHKWTMSTKGLWANKISLFRQIFILTLFNDHLILFTATFDQDRSIW